MITNDPFVFITKSGTKQIRNKNGYVLMRYKNIPKSIKFKHIAVNDYNQHLCNGWVVYDHTEFEEIDRVEQGLKPVGISHTYNLELAKAKIENLISKGFLATYVVQIFQNKEMYNVTASVTGTLGDYFDMDTLAADYKKCRLINDNIIRYKTVNFSEFHNGNYDCGKHPIEITGLILGYPIENTIALIKR
jgi:hypothetical protein